MITYTIITFVLCIALAIYIYSDIVYDFITEDSQLAFTTFLAILCISGNFLLWLITAIIYIVRCSLG